MSGSIYGTPSEDARIMLQELTDYAHNSSGGMLLNCAPQKTHMDGSTARTVWVTSVCTALVVIVVHISRLFTSHKKDSTEVAICLLAMAGVVSFIYDVQQCKLHRGMITMIVCLIIANGVLPRLFRHSDDLPWEEQEFD